MIIAEDLVQDVLDALEDIANNPTDPQLVQVKAMDAISYIEIALNNQ